MERTVLVIDPDCSHLSEILSCWHDQPWRTVTANSLEEAIDVLDDECVDMVIAVEDLGWLSGSEFLRLTHNRYPQMLRVLISEKPCGKEKPLSSLFHAEDHIHQVTDQPCDSEEMTAIVHEMFGLQYDRRLQTAAARLGNRPPTKHGAMK